VSFLVEIMESAYPANALSGFTGGSDFSLDNARALMWMSQLAYETAHESKVKNILEKLGMIKRGFATNDPVTGLPPKSACFVAAGGRNTTIIAFAGTDPLKIEDWITDFTVGFPQPDVLHEGFHAAVETVWTKVKAVIDSRPSTEQPLFFTGHSLGGALAIIAAARAQSELGMTATAVYTFGSPRTGGSKFKTHYAPLAERTFRLVDGDDIVAHVPPALGGLFCHVGRSLVCPSDGIFEVSANTPLSSSDQDNQDLVRDTLRSALSDIRAVASFRLLRAIGPRLLDRLAALLPRMVRDHVPANYFRALSIPLS
jgi:triacylglycerol lipase